MKMCGYFGCHVSDMIECECTECSSETILCSECTKFPNRARKDMFLWDGMQEKCNMCKDSVKEETEKPKVKFSSKYPNGKLEVIDYKSHSFGYIRQHEYPHNQFKYTYLYNDKLKFALLPNYKLNTDITINKYKIKVSEDTACIGINYDVYANGIMNQYESYFRAYLKSNIVNQEEHVFNALMNTDWIKYEIEK